MKFLLLDQNLSPRTTAFLLILLRVHPQTIEVLHPLLEGFFTKVSLQQLQSAIATIESHRYRLRKLR
jgi:hypothetical protein